MSRRSKRIVKKPARFQLERQVLHTAAHRVPLSPLPIGSDVERTIPRVAYHTALPSQQPSTSAPSAWSKPLGDEGNSDSYSACHISVKRSLKEYGIEAYHAIIREYEQLYKVKRAITPVHRSALSAAERRGIIHSHMFLNPKHDATGTSEKIKARLVGNGSQQDNTLYPDRIFPTTALESIMAVLQWWPMRGRRQQ